MAVDWSLSQTPDIAGATINALGVGRQMGQQDAQRRVLQGYNTDRAGTLDQLMAINPELAVRLQDQNAQEKTGVLNGQAHDQEQMAQGHQVIAALLNQVRNQSANPEERRAMTLHFIQQHASAWQPDQVQALMNEAQNFDFTDQSIDTYHATFGAHTAPQRPIVIGGIGYAQTPDGSLKAVTEAPGISPLDQARIAEINSRIPLHQAQAARAARPPVGRASGGGRRRGGGGHAAGGTSAAPRASGGNPWERDY